MIRIGTAGWQYKDWNGIVYPAQRPRGFDALSHIAVYFDVIEINSSFYGAPRPHSPQKWLASVAHNPNFRFTAKLVPFVHPTNGSRLRPMRAISKSAWRPYSRRTALAHCCFNFLGPSRIRPKNRAYLVSLHKRFAEYPLVVEVRHASWIEDNVLGLFAELGVGICNIDQPLFHRSVKPDAHVTAAIGYVRLHGRNYRNWFSKIADVRERYDHLYSLDELAPWVDRTKEIALHAKDTYVLSKNHNIGKAAVNSLDIRAIFTGQPVKVPPSLILAYPHLEVVAE